MDSEIIRDIVIATACTGFFILLGFSPLAFAHDASSVSSSRVSNVGMPIGQSGPSSVMQPLRLNEPRFSNPADLFRK